MSVAHAWCKSARADRRPKGASASGARRATSSTANLSAMGSSGEPRGCESGEVVLAGKKHAKHSPGRAEDRYLETDSFPRRWPTRDERLQRECCGLRITGSCGEGGDGWCGDGTGGGAPGREDETVGPEVLWSVLEGLSSGRGIEWQGGEGIGEERREI